MKVLGGWGGGGGGGSPCNFFYPIWRLLRLLKIRLKSLYNWPRIRKILKYIGKVYFSLFVLLSFSTIKGGGGVVWGLVTPPPVFAYVFG